MIQIRKSETTLLLVDKAVIREIFERVFLKTFQTFTFFYKLKVQSCPARLTQKAPPVDCHDCWTWSNGLWFQKASMPFFPLKFERAILVRGGWNCQNALRLHPSERSKILIPHHSSIYQFPSWNTTTYFFNPITPINFLCKFNWGDTEIGLKFNYYLVISTADRG